MSDKTEIFKEDDYKDFFEELSKRNDFVEMVNKCYNKSCKNSFNIFNILGVQYREVYMCRFLAELLDTNGCHELDTIFLEQFINQFLNSKVTNFNYENATVTKEDLTKDIENKKGRIDIVIDDGNYYIPIEVKINADEQPNQCQKYLDNVQDVYSERGNGLEPFIVFLTIDGRMPVTINETNKNKVICLSWGNIADYIKKCNISKNSDVESLLTQYIEVIGNFNKQGELIMNLQKFLCDDSNKNNFRIAQIIGDDIRNIENSLWLELCQYIQSNITKVPELIEKDRMIYNIDKKEANGIFTGLVIFSDAHLNKSRDYIYVRKAQYNKENGKYTLAGFIGESLKEIEFAKLVSGETKEEILNIIRPELN